MRLTAQQQATVRATVAETFGSDAQVRLFGSRVAAAERWLMRRFDLVSTISQRMHQRLLSKGVDTPKAKMAVNWVDMAQFALPSPNGVAAYRAELNIPAGAVVALYSGNGAGRADLVARCQGLTNVRFIDLQPAERLPDLLATADIHLLPQRADAADLVMPSKLTGMLASARAVVAHGQCGLFRGHADRRLNCHCLGPQDGAQNDRADRQPGHHRRAGGGRSINPS
jgi:colanic acid biosynthesis glycosyl transferase WcaI